MYQELLDQNDAAQIKVQRVVLRDHHEHKHYDQDKENKGVDNVM